MACLVSCSFMRVEMCVLESGLPKYVWPIAASGCIPSSSVAAVEAIWVAATVPADVKAFGWTTQNYTGKIYPVRACRCCHVILDKEDAKIERAPCEFGRQKMLQANVMLSCVGYGCLRQCFVDATKKVLQHILGCQQIFES